MVLIAAHLNAGVILVGGESVVVDNLPLPKKLTAHNNSVLKNTHVHTLRNTTPSLNMRTLKKLHSCPPT